jgi:hypothetical protein
MVLLTLAINGRGHIQIGYRPDGPLWFPICSLLGNAGTGVRTFAQTCTPWQCNLTGVHTQSYRAMGHVPNSHPSYHVFARREAPHGPVSGMWQLLSSRGYTLSLHIWLADAATHRRIPWPDTSLRQTFAQPLFFCAFWDKGSVCVQ